MKKLNDYKIKRENEIKETIDNFIEQIPKLNDILNMMRCECFQINTRCNCNNHICLKQQVRIPLSGIQNKEKSFSSPVPLRRNT